VPFQVLVFGVAFVLLGLLSDGAYAVAASAGVLIGLGVTTALAGSRSSSSS
jgi:hypothetical protein